MDFSGALKTVAVLLLLAAGHIEAMTIRVPDSRTSFDISHDYHVKLLTLALNAVYKGRELVTVKPVMPMVQGRAEAELIKGNILDVYWLGAHKDREKQLISIKVPTSKGLIGLRKFIINDKYQRQFQAISSKQELQQLTACSGSHWPDTEIMRNASFSVTTSPVFSQLFSMLAADRCQYFPRGYHDAEREVSSLKHQHPNIITNNDILFYYPFAIYFYTSKENAALANDIEQGMKMLATSGQLEQHMRSHPLTANIYPLYRDKPSKIIRLENPTMPTNSELDNPDYFYQLSNFNLIELQ